MQWVGGLTGKANSKHQMLLLAGHAKKGLPGKVNSLRPAFHHRSWQVSRAFVMAEPNRLLCLPFVGWRITLGPLPRIRCHFRAGEGKRDQAATCRVAKGSPGNCRVGETTEVCAGRRPKLRLTSHRFRIGYASYNSTMRNSLPFRHHKSDATGNTASTPVCDLENVYAVLGNGIVSSHRLDGQRNWIRFIGKPMPRHSASPLIAGNLLIVHLKQLVALDPRSGEIVWKTDTPPRNGTPVALTVGEQAVIVTPAGAIVRGEDGKVLAKDLFDLAYCSPIAQEGVVFAAERGRLLAIKLSPGDDKNTIQTEVLWETRGAQDDRLASPVVHGGLLFSATGSGILEVVDIATGKIIKRKRMEFGRGPG